MTNEKCGDNLGKLPVASPAHENAAVALSQEATKRDTMKCMRIDIPDGTSEAIMGELKKQGLLGGKKDAAGEIHGTVGKLEHGKKENAAAGDTKIPKEQGKANEAEHSVPKEQGKANEADQSTDLRKKLQSMRPLDSVTVPQAEILIGAIHFGAKD